MKATVRVSLEIGEAGMTFQASEDLPDDASVPIDRCVLDSLIARAAHQAAQALHAIDAMGVVSGEEPRRLAP